MFTGECPMHPVGYKLVTSLFIIEPGKYFMWAFRGQHRLRKMPGKKSIPSI
jgi:hypothetical protein